MDDDRFDGGGPVRLLDGGLRPGLHVLLRPGLHVVLRPGVYVVLCAGVYVVLRSRRRDLLLAGDQRLLDVPLPRDLLLAGDQRLLDVRCRPTYYSPVTSGCSTCAAGVAYAPVVQPYVSYAPVYSPYVAGWSVYGTPKLYVAGEPVRNTLRALSW